MLQHAKFSFNATASTATANMVIAAKASPEIFSNLQSRARPSLYKDLILHAEKKIAPLCRAKSGQSVNRGW
ncbi:MAG TPA: hypothetical protein DCG57_09025 [Candidatus Riflebacteria bacterium]|nr:hypothetical protein [Candidatus Riflebacteria bacterium]